MTHASKTAPALFLTMDGMRGLGAAMVVFAHSYGYWPGVPDAGSLGSYLIDMFFLLSGYVIAFAFERRIAAGMGMAEFLIQRIIRFYPVYALGIAMGLFVRLVTVGVGDDPVRLALETVPQFFFLPSFVVAGDQGWLFTLDVPAYTLFFELAINVLYIGVHRWLTRNVLIGVVGAFAVALTVSVLYYDELQTGTTWALFWGGFARAGFGFFAGVLMYRLAGAPRKPTGKSSPLALLALVPLVVLVFIRVPEDYRIACQLAVAFVVGPTVIYYAQTVQPPRFLWPLFARAGALSYAIYVLHYPLVQAVRWEESWLTGLPGMHTALLGITILAAAAAFSHVVEQYYDQPVRRMIAAYRKRAKSASVGARFGAEFHR